MYQVYASEIEAAFRHRRWQQEAAQARAVLACLDQGRSRKPSLAQQVRSYLRTPPTFRMRWPEPWPLAGGRQLPTT